MTQFVKSENCLNCIQCNSKIELFKMFNEEEIFMLNQNRYEVSFKTGENIIKQGTASSHVCLLTSGMAKYYIEGLDGKSVILELLLPYKFYGSPGLFTDNRHHYSITAVEPTTGCFIDIQNIKSLLRKNADFMEAFLGNCNLNSLHLHQESHFLLHKKLSDHLQLCVEQF